VPERVVGIEADHGDHGRKIGNATGGVEPAVAVEIS
jgi:hypothetical protein